MQATSKAVAISVMVREAFISGFRRSKIKTAHTMPSQAYKRAYAVLFKISCADTVADARTELITFNEERLGRT